MRASEWQYLCAVHEPPKSCCAIDYCCHTLEWAADTLTSTKFFPSRLTLGSEANGGSQGGVRQLTNIMRRVYRIFAHAWFQHRDTFWQLENDEGLYTLFKTVCDVYSLIPEENYTIPPEAEGLVTKEEDKEEPKPLERKNTKEKITAEDTEEKLSISTGATTRRHKHTPSLGSTVTTIQEGDEENTNDDSPSKLEDATPISALPQPHDSEPPLARVSKASEKGEESSDEAQLPATVFSEAVPPVIEGRDFHGEPKEVGSSDAAAVAAAAHPDPLNSTAVASAIKIEEQEQPEES